MTTLRTTVTAVAVALLLGLTGCAEDSDPDSQAGGGGNSATPPAETPAESESESPPSASQPATRVEYSRSGGIVGGEQATNTFVRGQAPPPGFTVAEQQEVLRAAAAPALRDLPAKKLPKDLCCDLFVYQVTVTWADGESRTYTAADGIDVAPALDHLLQVAAG
jgi:hypothetical protein